MSAVIDAMNEQCVVARNMIAYGGDFVIRLGQALLYADPENAANMKRTWPEYWEKYRTWEEKE